MVAAIVTSMFAIYLVDRFEDRRISDAAEVLVFELHGPARAHMTVAETVADENQEMSHTGILFAVFGESSGRARAERARVVARCQRRRDRTLPAADRQRLQLAEPRGEVVVYGDVMLLGTLISNALEFGSLVRVAVLEADNEAVLLISDDGPGVPVGDRQRVFEPFVRVRSAAARRVPGHGLGLALIAHVARWHGGSAKFIDGSPGAHLEVRLPRRSASSR
jgi:signal transduction histidine kinase